MIELVFDERKAAQAAARVLRRHGRHMHRDVLIRILYYVDRHCLVHHGYPVTGARFVCTPDGPALQQILDLTQAGACADTTWYRYVAPADGSFVSSTGWPDEGALSLVVCEMLDLTTDTLAPLSIEEVCRRSRQLPEWRMIDDCVVPVIIDDIFRAEGLSHLAIIDIAEKAAASSAVRSLASP